ncbi:MAG: tyrosine-type recombinase/integrase [Arcobacteraceae bacterium]|nr:tyrosine-type recombinase/integrase [Arcobacteraceae bacterium]
MTFEQLFLEYIELSEFMQSEHEIRNKKNRYDNHIKLVLGSKDIQDIKYKDVQMLLNNLIHKKELSVKTAKNILSIVQVCFNYAIKNDYIDKNPCSNLIYPKYNNKYDINVSKNDIKSLIDSIFEFENETMKDIFLVALHGRRKNEILSLQWNQIDLDLKIYNIPPQKNKSRKNDYHKMTEELYQMFLRRYNEASKIGFAKRLDFVFVNPNTLTRYQDISKSFNKLKISAGIKKMRFHDFRHILGTYAIAKKVPIEHISQALGHSSIGVTQKYITRDSGISKDVLDVFFSDFKE